MNNSITVDGVTYFREHPDLTKAKEAVEKFESIKYEINDALENARSLYDDFKSQGLDFNTIEAEGYLRCAITIKERLNYIETLVKTT